MADANINLNFIAINKFFEDYNISFILWQINFFTNDVREKNLRYKFNADSNCSVCTEFYFEKSESFVPKIISTTLKITLPVKVHAPQIICNTNISYPLIQVFSKFLQKCTPIAHVSAILLILFLFPFKIFSNIFKFFLSFS